MLNLMRITSLLLVLALPLGAQSFESPMQYFNFFNQAHSAIVSKNMEYIQHAVHSDDIMAIAQKRIALINSIDQTIKNVSALPPYPQDAGIRQEMMAVLTAYKEVFKVDFEQVESLKQQSKASYQAMERYLNAQDMAEKRMADTGERFLNAQRQFAKTNNIQLLEGSPDPEMEQLQKLNNYQRIIFLSGFKLGKTDAEFMDALQGADKEAPGRLRLQLEREAKAELARLRALPAFNGNTAYRDATIRQIEFQLDMALNYYPAMIRINTKAQSEITQEDVDAYNAAVEKVNNEFNPLVAKTNEALLELMRQNVPKPSIRDTKQI